MKVIRCQNSHFYDADKYNECPVCGAAPLAEGGAKKPATSQSHFWGGKKEHTISPSTEPVVEPIQQSAEPPVAENPMKTVGMFGESDAKENDYEEFKIQVNKEFDEPVDAAPGPQSAVRVAPEPVREENPIQAQKTARVDSLEELVNEGKIDIENINESCRRVLTLKFKLGLFEKPYTDEEEYKEIINCKEHLDKALEIAKRL